MPYLAIEDFRAGVDRRRARALGRPGQLWPLTNAHINAGGEIERRKKWVKRFDLPANCFGLVWARGRLWTFGSLAEPKAMPPGLSYHRLDHPSTTNDPVMTRLVDVELFSGKFYVIADYSNGDTLHFYDGKTVKALLDGEGQFTPTIGSVAQKLAAMIAEDGWSTVADTTANSAAVIIEGAIGQDFTVTASVLNGKTDTTQAADVKQLQASQLPIAAIAATARFTVLTGDPAAALSDLQVDGVPLIRASVPGDKDPLEWAESIRLAINAGGSLFTADRDGATIILRAPESIGAGLNGRAPVLFQIGNALGAPSKFAGGKNGYGGTGKRVAVYLLGKFEKEDSWMIRVNAQAYGYVSGRGGVGRVAKTDGDKLYLGSGSILSFSKIADPLTFFPHENGAGFVNFNSHFGGSEDITGIESFGTNLAVFSASAVQIWRTDADPAKMARLQTMPNTGALSGRSVASYGDSDVFYLAKQGIRTLRPRGDTELGEVGDIGAPIDALVTEWVASQHPATVARAQSAVEPVGGHYWLAVGRKAFVFSYFRSSKISAWSAYDLPFTVDRFVVAQQAFYALGTDRAVYQYGGPAGDEWDDGEILVETPFLSLTAPATHKALKGLDIIAPLGEWDYDLLLNPDSPDVVAMAGRGLTGTTTPELNIPLNGISTHAALRLRCTKPGPARLSAIILHFVKGDAE
jgi:hypothetical protein